MGEYKIYLSIYLSIQANQQNAFFLRFHHTFLLKRTGGSARRTRHARRQGMGPTCLFRRSQRVVERRRVCVVELAIGPFSILVFYTLCLLLTEAKNNG